MSCWLLTLDLFDKRILEKYDPQGMHLIYEKWPDLAEEYFKIKYEPIDFKRIDHLIFTGMGGSGAVGDTLSSIFSKTKMHLGVVKGYHLPKTADSNTLVVVTSASGQTVETLTVLNKAYQSGCKIVSFSSGGKMQDYCTKNKIEFRKVPILNSPRASYPAYLYSILNVLGDFIPVKKSEILHSINTLKTTRRKISSSNLDDNPAIELAKWLDGIPMIYYPMGLQATAIRFKNSLQENAKIHAIAEDVIEACHNGIVSWERSSNVKPILLQGRDDYEKTKELWKIIKEYFDLHGIKYHEMHSVKGTILSKIINLVYLLDYSSIYHAVMKKTNPTPIKSIDFVKSKMR